MTGWPGEDSLAGGPHDIVYSARLGWCVVLLPVEKPDWFRFWPFLNPFCPPW